MIYWERCHWRNWCLFRLYDFSLDGCWALLHRVETREKTFPLWLKETKTVLQMMVQLTDGLVSSINVCSLMTVSIGNMLIITHVHPLMCVKFVDVGASTFWTVLMFHCGFVPSLMIQTVWLTECHVSSSSSSVSQLMNTESSWSRGRRNWKLMQKQLQKLQPKLWRAKRNEDVQALKLDSPPFLFILTLYMYHIQNCWCSVCQILINIRLSCALFFAFSFFTPDLTWFRMNWNNLCCVHFGNKKIHSDFGNIYDAECLISSELS